MTSNVVSVARSASLDEAMELMDERDVRHLPVVDGDRLVGVLSERDLLELTGWLPKRVREMLESPSGQVGDYMHAPVVTVSPADTLVTASMRLKEWNVGCLPVLDETELVGMLTDSDVIGAFVKSCRTGRRLDPAVSEVMTTQVVSSDAATPAEQALALCRAEHVRHLPVCEHGALVGIVSDRDLRLCIGRGDLEGTPIGELGPDELVTVTADAQLSEAAKILVHDHIGAVPVVDGNKLIGLVTSADVLEHCTKAFATVSDGSQA